MTESAQWDQFSEMLNKNPVWDHGQPKGHGHRHGRGETLGESENSSANLQWSEVLLCIFRD